MEKNPMVSIIMPVYKVEEYIERAIESILSQTLTDWDLWLIDDGSPDRSGKICDDYAKKDTRLKVLHKENGGAPSARNVAINQAKGKYFYFMDSDDWAEAKMLEDMVTIAETYEVQLVIAGYYIDTYCKNNYIYTQELFLPSQNFLDAQSFRIAAYQLFDKNLLYTPWNKLYSSHYILSNNLRFPNTLWDDFPFNLSVIKDIDRVFVTENKYYHFIRKREDSETAKFIPNLYEKREEEHQSLLDLYNYWGVCDSLSNEFLARRYIERIIGCIENITSSKNKQQNLEKLKEIKKIINTVTCINYIKIIRPQSFMMKLMIQPIKLRNTILTYLQSCLISKVKSSNTKLFAKLKANR